MTKKMTKLMALILVASMLTACGGSSTTITLGDSDTNSVTISQSTESSETVSVSETQQSDTETDSPKAEDEKTETSTSEEAKDEPVSEAIADIKDDASLEKFIIGEWMYAPGTDIAGSVARLIIKDDHTYELKALGADENKEEKGTWELNKTFAFDNGVSKLLCFDCGDGQFGAGDYLIDTVTIIENHYIMSTVQANNGESFINAYFNDINPLFIKKEEVEYANAENLVKNSTFDALIWSASDDTLMISPFEDGKIINPAVNYSYVFANENEGLDYSDLAFAPVRVVTDADGKISSYQLYRNDKNYVVKNYSSLDYIHGYVYDVHDYTVKDEDANVTIVAYTSLPHFIGDSQTAKTLNAAMADVDANYSLDIEATLQEELELFKVDQFSGEFSYMPIDLKNLYWDPNGGVISIGLSWDWYMGGVANHGYYTYNYDPINSKYLTLCEFIGKTEDETNSLLEEAFYNQYGMEADMSLATTKKFFFDETTITCVFDSYELELGNFCQEVTIPR